MDACEERDCFVPVPSVLARQAEVQGLLERNVSQWRRHWDTDWADVLAHPRLPVCRGEERQGIQWGLNGWHVNQYNRQALFSGPAQSPGRVPASASIPDEPRFPGGRRFVR